MLSLDALLLVVALICFACEALGVKARVNLLAVGLFCAVLTGLV